ncbi:MAG: hypothetical protein ACRCVJ_12510 [Clostridium sp.]|uniref:hypothetical protein n=1 Tax=Clostridium sp. TaxID=1506 RepID=UPI003F349103
MNNRDRIKRFFLNNKLYIFITRHIFGVLLSVILMIVFINYSYYLQKPENYINNPPLITLFGFIDTILFKVDGLFNNIISTFKEPLVIKWGMFFIIAIYLIMRLDLNKVFSSIDEISINGLKVSMKAQGQIKKEIEKKKKLEEESTSNKAAINDIEKKIKIMEILRDNPYISGIIDRWINKNIKKTTIPMKKIQSEIGDIKILDELFDYKINGTSVILTGLKKDSIEDIVEVYNQLFKN